MNPTRWQALKIYIARAWVYIYMSGIYKTWSRVYRAIWERETAPLKVFKDIDEFIMYIRSFKWRMDSWKELGDACSSPGRVQYLANTDPNREIGDCDEFAIYEATVLAEQKFEPLVEETFFLDVVWYRYAGYVTPHNGLGFGGHNVCLIRRPDGLWCYMDYNYPSIARETVDEVVRDILTRYAPNSWLVRWTYTDRDLNRVATGT